MSCPEGSRLALDLAEAKNASVLTDTHSPKDDPAQRLVEIRNGLRATQSNVSDLLST